MRLLKEIIKREEGLAMPAVLITLLVGGLIIGPFLNYLSTGLRTGQAYENKMYELYAADAGVEDAMHRIVSGDAALYNLDVDESLTYGLFGSVNDLPVNTTVTKTALLEGVLADDEYKQGQPHEGWVGFDTPAEIDQTEDYVEYSCDVVFVYDGVGVRQIQTVGTTLYPIPGDESLIEGPYDVVPTPIITFDDLQAGSPETIISPGSFTFLWRWENNQGPVFDNDDRDGALSFKFKIYDPAWESSLYFAFATFKEQDISYVTNQPDSYVWVVESTAGDTMVKSVVLGTAGALEVLTWEVSP
jgi:hypothetical protein